MCRFRARQNLRKAVPLEADKDAPVGPARFVETEERFKWLHRQVLAAHPGMTLPAGAGIRLVCGLLQLSGLARFVVRCYGSQHEINVALQEAVPARLTRMP